MSVLDCRRAVADDKSGICAMGRFYGGFDYFPLRYDSYLDDDRRHVFVAEKDGAIVSFTIATILDEGETVVFSGSRTDPDHQGNKYIKILKEFAMADIRAKYPGLHSRLAVFQGEAGTRYRERYDVTTIMKRLTISLAGGDFRDKVKQFKDSCSYKTRPLSQEETIATILKEKSPHLFPHSHLVVTYEAIGKIWRENISRLPQVNTRAVFSDDVTCCRLLSISFRTTYMVEEVRRITQIDIYGDVSVSDAIRHMADQLTDVMTEWSNDHRDFLLVHTPFEFEMRLFQKECEDKLGLVPDEEFDGQNHTLFLIRENI